MRVPMPSPHGTNRERLFINPRRGAAYDANPDRRETLRDFMLRKGLTQDHVDAFEALCRIGDAENQQAEDDEEEEAEEGNTGERTSFSNTEVGDKMSEIDEFIRDKLQGDDLEIHRNMLGSLMRAAGGGASDMLPTGPGGTGLPKNRIDLQRQAMDARITTGSDSFGRGHDRGRVPMPADRKPKSDAAKYAPGIEHITIGA
jgi:hypothetical protein